MKTLTKTFGLSLILSLTLMTGSFTNAKADCFTKDCSAPKTDTLSSSEKLEDGFNFDFSDPFFFSNEIVIHVYNEQDELVFNKSYTKEEAKSDQELKAILKNSDFLLSIDDKHFYYTSKGK